jgi:hypothetical protein
VVTGRQQPERAVAMRAVLRRVDERRSEQRPTGYLLPRAELALGWDAVRVSKASPTPFVRLGHGHEADFLWMAEGECPVGQMAPVASPHQNCF